MPGVATRWKPISFYFQAKLLFTVLYMQSYVKHPGCLSDHTQSSPTRRYWTFSVVVLISEPGSGAHYCSIPNGPLTLITLAVVVVWIFF